MVVGTRGAITALSEAEVLFALARHRHGDWGDLDAGDRAANDAALRSEGRLFSSYRSASGTRFYVITEWDRSLTTVLLPSEY
jgi:hypothetical protein